MTIVFDEVAAYHQVHGDDYGSSESRKAKYRAVLDMVDPTLYDIVLDVGCGERKFRRHVPCGYIGIDITEGQNVMDWTRPVEWVVANGIVYKLPDERSAKEVLAKCWSICTKGFVFTSLDSYCHYCEDELTLDPFEMTRWATRIAHNVKLDMSYKAGDFAVGMFR